MRETRAVIRSSLALRGEAPQSLTGKSANTPIRKKIRTERTIKIDGWPVPVEHRPFEPAAFARHCELSKVTDQGLAITMPARLGNDEQVFEIQAAARKERREVVEKQRESDCTLAFPTNDRLDDRIRAEQLLLQLSFSTGDLMHQPLVLRKPAHERMQNRNVFGPR